MTQGNRPGAVGAFLLTAACVLLPGCATGPGAVRRRGEILSESRVEALASYGRAHALEGSGELEKAMPFYEQAAEADPSHRETFFRLGLGYLRLGRKEDALRAAAALTRNHPRSAQAWHWTGLIYQSAGLQEEALRALRRSVRLGPEEADYWTALAAALAQSDRTEEALRALRRGAAAVPAPAGIHRAQGLLLLRQAVGGDHASSDLLQAAEALQLAAELEPDQIDTWFDLAAAHHLREQPAEAAEAYLKILALDPREPQVRWRLAIGLSMSGRFEEAAGIIESLAEQRADDPQPLLLLGKLYQRLDRREEALAAFRRAAETDPETSEAYLLPALLQFENDPSQALESVREGLRFLPDNLQLNEILAALLLEQQHFAEALAAAEKALELLPDEGREPSPSLLLVQALGAFFSGRGEQAAGILESAPGLIEAFFGQALQLIGEKGDHGELVSLLESFEERTALRVPGMIALGVVHSAAGRYAEAAEAYDRAEAAASEEGVPLGGSFFFYHGAARERLGEIQAAEDLFLGCIDLDPDHHLALNYLAYMWAERGLRLEEALAFSLRSLELDPENPAYLDTLGWIYYQQGEAERALPSLRKAAELLPDDPTVLDHLGDVYHALGRTGEALDLWRRAFDVEPQNEAIGAKLKEHAPPVDPGEEEQRDDPAYDQD